MAYKRLDIAFLTYLKKTVNVTEESGILLAVSGGVDSMVMLRLFESTSYRIVVAHCNFSLRGEASEGDESMIRNYCQERGLVFETIQFETLKVASEEKISTQMAARVLRYPWFDSLLVKHNLDFVATAHHASDSLETALLNLTRGTGINGLKGILPKSKNLIRPILFARKEELLAFAKEHHIPWREDSSNSSDKYHRNFVRHQVVPLLEKLNPKLIENFSHTSARVNHALDFIKSQLVIFKEQSVKSNGPDFEISQKVFFEGSSRTLVEFWLEELNFNYASVLSIFEEEQYHSGRQFLSSTHRLLFDRDKVLITPVVLNTEVDLRIEKDLTEISFAFGQLNFKEVEDLPALEALKSPNKAYLDTQKLKFPLVLRNWRNGDIFQPFGMKGNKRVSDYLINQKVPVYDKEKTLVLCSGNEIVWLVGHRISEKFKIGKSSETILEVVFTLK